MASKKLPNRWNEFTNYGEVILDLFVPHKAPLRLQLTGKHSKLRFTPDDLMDRFPEIGLVIDLTQTQDKTKYYNPLNLEEKDVSHVKIPIRGGGKIPPYNLINKFISTVTDFAEKHPGKLIGVHCTHGINRTGFMICNYLIRKQNMDPKNALEMFEEARGHKIERETYVNYLLKNKLSQPDRSIIVHHHPPPNSHKVQSWSSKRQKAENDVATDRRDTISQKDSDLL